MRTIVIALVLAPLCCAGAPVRADESAKPDAGSTDGALRSAFADYGYKLDDGLFEGFCRPQVTLDLHTFIQKIPDLQSIGVINRELTQTRINTAPNSLAMTFSLLALTLTVHDFYKRHPDADECQFTESFKDVDDYGQSRTFEIASFRFTKDLYKRINWDQFEWQKLTKVSIGFYFTPDFMRKVAAEN